MNYTAAVKHPFRLLWKQFPPSVREGGLRHHSRGIHSTGVHCRATLMLLVMMGMLAQGRGANAEAVTFTKNIAPIIFNNCANCHRPGEVAPFSLLTYSDVAKRAKQIGIVTQKRLMPPWKLETGYGEFQHARRLTDQQIALIQQWAKEGAKEGNLSDLPPAPQFPDGWQLGKPDMILKMPKPYAVPAEGKDVTRSFVISLHLPADKYIRATEIRPGDRRVVHHVTLMMDKSGKAKQLEAQQGGPGSGYVSFGGPGFLPSGGLPGYVPGTGAEVIPADASAILPKDIDLVFGMHYHPCGREAQDQTSVGLYFTDKPPTKIGSLIAMGVLNIDIAPGEKDHLEETTYTLPVDVEVESIYEHMHLIGKTCKLWAELPDHSIRPIIKINDWDFNWQSTYHVKERYRLPKGTILHGEWTHDNSTDNPANPNHPPKEVKNGEDYVNEMAGVLVNVYVDSQTNNGILWIANLGHLGAASVRPPAHHREKRSNLGAKLLENGMNGAASLAIDGTVHPGQLLAEGTFALLTFLSLPGLLALLLPASTARAAASLDKSFGRSFGLGLLVLLVLPLPTLGLLFSFSPAAQILGTALLLSLVALGAIGGGGLARWMARRLRPKSKNAETAGILFVAGLLVVVLCLVPYLGWLLIAPLCVILGLGAGASTLGLPQLRSRRFNSALVQPQRA